LQDGPRGRYRCRVADSEEKRRAHYGVNYDRLAKVKSEYGPGNLMRLNANIEATL